MTIKLSLHVPAIIDHEMLLMVQDERTPKGNQNELSV